jgi:hypothetical protein
VKRSLPEDEVRTRVDGLPRMLAAPVGEFDPTLPGLFAGDPPADFLPLLEEMAADVRPESMRIPDTKLVVISGAGHVSNLERPEPFNDAVREFCRAHPPRHPEPAVRQLSGASLRPTTSWRWRRPRAGSWTGARYLF